MSDAASNNAGNNFVNNDDDEGGGDGFEPYNPPADRFLSAQMWWIASELVRRHPHLRISGHEIEDEGRLVIVHDEQDAMSIQWDLVGGCKYLVNGVVKKISWIEMMAAASPHETVKRIELATGLGIPKATPDSTPRALAYRVIASALATTVDDRHDWYAVPAPMTIMDGLDRPGCTYFDEFPTALAARDAYGDEIEARLVAGTGVYFFQPFWALLCNLEPIAILDAAGVIHTILGEAALLPAYKSLNHNLAMTTSLVLGPHLP